jgi:predicted nucleotidyltransferase
MTTAQLQLATEYHEIVLNILRGFISHGEIWVFGSRVCLVPAKKFSDLDLVFLGTPKLTINEIGQLQEAFSASDLPFKVDISNFSDLPAGLQENINTNHIKFLTF